MARQKKPVAGGPTYTPAQKQRMRGMIKAFEGCKEHLRARKFICFALRASYNFQHAEAYEDAYHFIMRALDGSGSLETWQYTQGLPNSTDIQNYKLRLKMLDTYIAALQEAVDS